MTSTELKSQGHSPDPGSSRASHQSLPVRWRIVWDRGTTQERNEKFHSSLRQKPVFQGHWEQRSLRALGRRGRAGWCTFRHCASASRAASGTDRCPPDTLQPPINSEAKVMVTEQRADRKRLERLTGRSLVRLMSSRLADVEKHSFFHSTN